jgi:hypothetical protein
MVIVQQMASSKKSALVWTLADVTLFDGRNTTAPGTIFTKQSQKTK